MNRQKKESLVQKLHTNFQDSQSAFVVDYKGLTVDQMQAFRSQLRQEGGSLHVAKARLLKRAVDGVGGSDDLVPYLKDQIGVVFAYKDVPVIAKVIQTFAKDNKLELIVGLFEDRVLDKQTVVKLASLPSKPELLGILVGTLKAPISKLVYTLDMLILRLIFTLQAVKEQKK